MPTTSRALLKIVATTGLVATSVAVLTGTCAGTAAATPAAPSTGVTSPAGQNWLDDQESPTHKYTQAEAVAQATRFSLISALPNTYKPYVAAMKAANRNLRLVVYMNGTMANGGEAKNFPESWFLHDRNGNRIHNEWHLLLMNVANPGWINNRVSTCANLVATTGYDGCFLDNLGAGTFGIGMVSGTPVDPATGKPYASGAWLSRAANLAATVRSRTGKLIFSNGLVSGQSYFSSVAPSSVLLNGSEIALAETFIRTARMGITEHRSLAAWKQDVDMLARASEQGKRVAVLTKVWAQGTQQQIDDWHGFALGSFLLGANGQQEFEFSDSPRAAISAGDWMLPKLARLGLASGPYTAVNGVYERAFSGGRVLVNPTSSALTVPLNKTYIRALLGTTVSGSTTLPPHTAQFLIG